MELVKEMVQRDATAAHLKQLEAKLAKIPKNPPREVQQAQDAVQLQRHKTTVTTAFTKKQSQHDQKQAQIATEIEQADVNLTKMEQAAELEYQRNLAVFRDHHAITIAKKKEEKEKGEADFETARSKQVALMLDIDAALATAGPVAVAPSAAPTAAASSQPPPPGHLPATPNFDPAEVLSKMQGLMAAAGMEASQAVAMAAIVLQMFTATPPPTPSPPPCLTQPVAVAGGVVQVETVNVNWTEEAIKGQAEAITAARLHEEEKWKHLSPEEVKAARHQQQELVHRRSLEAQAQLKAIYDQNAKLDQEAATQQAAMMHTQAEQLQQHQQQQQQQQQQLLQQQQQQKEAVAEQQVVVQAQALAIVEWDAAIKQQQRQDALQSFVPKVEAPPVDVNRVRERSTSPRRCEGTGRWRSWAVAANSEAAAAAETAAAAARKAPLPGAIRAAAEARESRR